MPKVTSEHVDARRAQILRAATTCFANKGFAETTMQDIFAEAGLSAGAVYNYFESKRDILYAVFDHHIRENQEATVEVREAEHSQRALRANLLGSLALFEDPKMDAEMRLPVMVAPDVLRDPEIGERQRKLRRSTVEAYRELTVQLQAEGKIDPDLDAEYVCWAGVCFFEGWRMLKLADPHLSNDRLTRVLDVLFEPLFGTPEKKKGS